MKVVFSSIEANQPSETAGDLPQSCFHITFWRSLALQWKKSWPSSNFSTMSVVGYQWVASSWSKVFPLKNSMSPENKPGLQRVYLLGLSLHQITTTCFWSDKNQSSKKGSNVMCMESKGTSLTPLVKVAKQQQKVLLANYFTNNVIKKLLFQKYLNGSRTCFVSRANH